MADLTVTITEAITLQNANRGSTFKKTITGVGEVDRRVVTVESDTNGTEIFKTGGTTEAGTHIPADVKYIRITNLDSTNWMVLFFTDGSAQQAMFKVEAGKSFILSTPVGFDTDSGDGNGDDIDEFSAATITSIQAKANSADVKAEIFVATA